MTAVSLLQDPLLKRAIYEAVFLASSFIDRCVGAACAGLEEAERHGGASSANRQLIADALYALNQKRGHFKARFPGQIEDAIKDALAQVDAGDMASTPSGNAPLTSTSGRQDQVALALLDDAEMLRFVESSKLQQTVLPAVERTLGRLDSLMSSVMGLPAVRPDLNPMRPEVMCNTLQSMIDALDQPRPVLSLWLRYLAKPYADELNALYTSVTQLLEDKGVREARYRVRLSVVGGGGGGGGTGHTAMGDLGPADAGPTTMGAGGSVFGSIDGVPVIGGPGSGSTLPGLPLDALPALTELARTQVMVPHAVVHDFLYQPLWVQANDTPLPEGYHAVAQRELQALSVPVDAQVILAAWQASQILRAQRREQAAVDRPPQAVALDTGLNPEEWGQYAHHQQRTQVLAELKAEAQQLSQVLGLDAVRALIEQVASDTRVLAPVREAFVALEPALLRLAMADPRFFADEEHPARQLVEGVAQRSFKFNDEFAPSFEAFMGQVREQFRGLLDAQTDDPNAFADALAALQATWDAEDEAEKEAGEQGLRSIEFAQKRQEVANRIAWEFSLRSDLVDAPAPVTDFLFESWSLVIAHAQLTDTRAQLDPGGYLAIVTDLLWSVKPSLTLQEPARLFELLPSILQTLRRGLDTLGKPPEETQVFFTSLMRYHEPVLQLRRARTGLDGRLVNPADKDILLKVPKLTPADKPHVKPEPRAVAAPWLGQRERGAAGFEEPMSDEAASPDTMMAPTDLASLEEASPESAATDRQADEDDNPHRLMLSRLQRGDWVDLKSRGEWHRARLVWSNDNGGLFMFVSSGGRPHTMTRRSCLRLLQLQRMRPVEHGEVVDKAMRRLGESDRPAKAGAGSRSSTRRRTARTS